MGTRGMTRTFKGMEINILCHMFYVYNYKKNPKKFVIFFWVPVLAKLALTNVEAFTVRACSSTFPTPISKFIRTSMAARTCKELGLLKISKRLFDNGQSAVGHLMKGKSGRFAKT